MRKPIQKLQRYYSVLGLQGLATFLAAKIRGTHPIVKKRLAGIKYPVYVRAATTDLSVLMQVLIERHYDCELPLQPSVIVDAGANVGLSAVFFANKYPEARIVAIEPEPGNFKVLQQNVSAYPQIQPVEAALWSKDQPISLVDPGIGAHGFQTVDQNPRNCERHALVQAFALDTIMECFGLKTIDILKIDIEGAEKEVLEHSAPWIDKVNVIMLELHDHLKPGCSHAFWRATAGFRPGPSRGEIVVRLRGV